VGKLCKAATKDINDAWRMYSPIEFEDVAGGENEQVFNVNQSKDEMNGVKVIVIAAHALEVNKY
jgi:hypothetical protein